MHDTNDNVTTKTQSTFHTAHLNFNTWIDAREIPCARSPIVRFWSSSFAHHIVAQVWLVRIFELSIPSNFLFFSFIFNLLQSLLHFFRNLEGSSNTAYFTWKEMDSTDESYLLSNSVIHSGGDSSKNEVSDQQRLQMSDLHFDKLIPTPATFACWKISFKTEVCACSHFLWKLCFGSIKWRWLIQWMIIQIRHQKEKLKWRILKYSMRELLQHWTESFIILTSKEESVWRNKSPRSRTVSFAEDRLLTWSMSTSGSQEPMILSRIVPTYSLWSSKWRYSGIRFKVGRNFIIND